ncbi:MAG: LPS-assembly protein LptD [Selenomonadaceae bacterium]|nr:LPS-assembly protein LptD [Selenomonadaceae bacterium]
MRKFLRGALPLLAALCVTSTAEAVYEADSDTGTGFFDYIENRRREERENQLTEEQEKLLKDIEEAKERLPHEQKPEDPAPAVFEGDDMVYYSGSGEFIATGKVDIIQLEGYRFQTDEATGNVKDKVVRVDGKGHVLQLTPNAPRVTLDGYKTVYNYGTKTGTMGEAKGKAGEYYLTGKRFEFYPDHIVVYNGTQTKCGAKSPDYHLSAERMEIWPEQVIRMYNVKFWIKNKVVGQRAYHENKMGEKGKNYFPRVGYNSDHGVYIRDTFEFALAPHLDLSINAHIESKKGIRSNAELEYGNRGLQLLGKYGYYYDSNDVWIQKEPSLYAEYSKKLGDLPVTGKIKGEVGHWRQNAVSALHQEYEINFAHDPIFLGKYLLVFDAGYKITKDSPENSTSGNTTVRGMNYNVLLGREFDKRLAAYVSYSYNKNNSSNSLFTYDTDDYSKKVQAGISYVLTPRDRFVVGLKWDADNHKLDDIDYYWYHDLHCSQAVLRWRGKRKKLEVHWEFIPW